MRHLTDEEIENKNWHIIWCMGCGKTFVLGVDKNDSIERMATFCFDCENSGRAYHLRDSALLRAIRQGELILTNPLDKLVDIC